MIKKLDFQSAFIFIFCFKKVLKKDQYLHNLIYIKVHK